MSGLLLALQNARQRKDASRLVDAIPYAGLLGMLAEYNNDNEIEFLLPPSKGNIGNPTLPAIHGGALGGFMEMSAGLHLMLTTSVIAMPKVVDFSIDYVRAGRLVETFCRCDVVRQGRTVANVAVTAWQVDVKDPIATARAHFILED